MAGLAAAKVARRMAERIEVFMVNEDVRSSVWEGNESLNRTG
jgi:hypothetical protein